MELVFDTARKEDIERLVELRIAYMIDDFGKVTKKEKENMERVLPDYFERKLGTELIAFVARDNGIIVSVAYLHIIEMPASPSVPTGLYGHVLSVYTCNEYRRQGLCERLMTDLVNYSKENNLSKIELSATKEGKRVYKKVGFIDKLNLYSDMIIRIR